MKLKPFKMSNTFNLSLNYLCENKQSVRFIMEDYLSKVFLVSHFRLLSNCVSSSSLSQSNLVLWVYEMKRSTFPVLTVNNLHVHSSGVTVSFLNFLRTAAKCQCRLWEAARSLLHNEVTLCCNLPSVSYFE